VEFCRIADNVTLGKDVMIHAFVNLYGCSIDDYSRVGAFVEIQKGARIGKRCKISSHTFICEGVVIEDNVFVGHNVTFINDKYPQAVTPGGEVQTDTDWQVVPTVVEEGAAIGSSVTILCGVRIGRGALIGAGSLVLRDIPPGEVWAGNPAKYIKKK
jgi:acetyltransferase-like isoleucine patch superfamily enzyme